MIGEKRLPSAVRFTWEVPAARRPPAPAFSCGQDRTCDLIQVNRTSSTEAKRKAPCDTVAHPAWKQCRVEENEAPRKARLNPAVSMGRGADRSDDAPMNGFRKRDSDALSISCLHGSTMRIPLGGKTVPFRVARRRGSGISSVVFDCERIDEGSTQAAGLEGNDCPRIVTVKVSC